MLLTAAASIAWLDKPIAYLVHNFGLAKYLHDSVLRIVEPLRLRMHGPNFVLSFFVLLLVLFLLIVIGRRLALRRSGTLEIVLVLSGFSLIASIFLKTLLKFAFGRAWPEYAFPSLIHGGVYGFFPFHPGFAFKSFPSGHAAAICAVISVFWLFYPRLRLLLTTCVAALGVALVAGNYHFLSDVIVGGFVGASTGVLAVAMWARLDALRRPVRPG